jgi:hypothetical protein
MVTNFFLDALTIPKAIVLGVAEEVFEPMVARKNPSAGNRIKGNVKPDEAVNKALYHTLLARSWTVYRTGRGRLSSRYF